MTPVLYTAVTAIYSTVDSPNLIQGCTWGEPVLARPVACRVAGHIATKTWLATPTMAMAFPHLVCRPRPRSNSSVSFKMESHWSCKYIAKHQVLPQSYHQLRH